MEMALILVSVVSFFALIAAWAMLPVSENVVTKPAATPAAAPLAH
jgi:hypothetical protein